VTEFVVQVQGAEELAARFQLAATRVRQVAYSSVNREAASLRTRVSRFVTDEVRLKRLYVLGRIKIKPAVLAANDAEAVVSASQDNVLLSRYDVAPKTLDRARYKRGATKGRSRPVSVFVSDEGGRKTLENAFLIRLKNSGATAVAFRLKGEGGRLKISYGPSVDQVFRTAVEKTPILAETEARLQREIARRLNVELNA